MVTYAYLDASAIAKLVVLEPETAALERDLLNRRGLLSSRLAATELRRAARRAGRRRILQQVDEVLDTLVLVDVSTEILDRAGRLAPPELRTLDAIHLATATSLGIRDLEFITYDTRLASAARTAGLVVVRPS